MPAAVTTPIDVGSIALPDARTGTRVRLGALRGVYCLVLIRHRY